MGISSWAYGDHAVYAARAAGRDVGVTVEYDRVLGRYTVLARDDAGAVLGWRVLGQSRAYALRVARWVARQFAA